MVSSSVPPTAPSLARTWPLLVVLFVFNVTLFSIEATLGQGVVGHWLGEAMLPPLSRVGQSQAWLGGVLGALLEMGQYAVERDRLEAEIVRLQSELSEADRARTENQKLRALLRLPKSRNRHIQPAQVIGWSHELLSRYVMIDAGAAYEVAVDMPVLGPDGQLIGRVEQVYAHASRVLLVSDPRFRIGVVTRDQSVEGVLQGRGRELVWQAQRPVALPTGTELVTSRNSWLYPPELRVARLVAPASNTQHPALVDGSRPVREYLAEPVESLDDPAQLRMALVVMDHRPGAPASAADGRRR